MVDRNNKTRILLLRPKSDVIKESGHPRAIRPPYILKYIEALLKQDGGFDINFQDCLIHNMSFEDLITGVCNFKPHIICIYKMSFDRYFIDKFIARVRSELNPLFVLLGQGILDGNVDGVTSEERNVISMKGEAEESFFALAKDVQKGENYPELAGKYNVSSFCYVDNPSRLPFPRYTKEEYKRYSFLYPLKCNRILRWGHILSSRGCPYGCIFCSPVMRESYGKKVRLRNAKEIVEEVIYQKNSGVNIFSFDDDDFTASREHVLFVCEELIDRKVDLPWIVHARVDEVDKEMLRLMKKAGCILMRFGVESASERVLLGLNKGNPREWISKSRQAFRDAKEVGLGTAALFFVGSPGERKEDIESSISFAKELDSDTIQVSFFTPYPGSSIYEKLKDSLKPSKIDKMYHYSSPVINLSEIDTISLIKLQKRFYKEFILRFSFLLRHLKRFFLFYLLNMRLTFALLRSACQMIKASK